MDTVLLQLTCKLRHESTPVRARRLEQCAQYSFSTASCTSPIYPSRRSRLPSGVLQDAVSNMLLSLEELDPPKRDDSPLLDPVLLVSLLSDESLESLESLASPLLALLEPPESNEASPLVLEAVLEDSAGSAELVVDEDDALEDPAFEAIQSAPCVVSPLAL